MTLVQSSASPTSGAFAWDAFFSAVLRDDTLSAPHDLTQISTADFLAACTAHGVTPLVYRQLHQSGTLAAWPMPLQTALSHQVRLHAAIDALREQALRARA